MYTYILSTATLVSIFALLRSQNATRRTIFEPGVLIILFFSACYLIPGIGANIGVPMGSIVDQFNYTNEVENISFYGIAFIIFFTTFYMLFGRFSINYQLASLDTKIEITPKECFIGYISLFSAIQIIFISYGVSNSETYTDQYVIKAAFPTAITQLVGVLQATQLMLLFLLLIECSNPKRGENAPYYLGTILAILVADMIVTESRVQVVNFLLLVAIFSAFHGKSLGLRNELLASTLLVTVMAILSIKREAGRNLLEIDFSDIAIPSEFVFIYTNSLYLMSLHETSHFIETPGNSYLLSLFSFIPKQLYTSKWDLSSWFMSTYFRESYENGQGLAFGIIPEALVNWGFASIIFQAIVLALVFRISTIAATTTRMSGNKLWMLFYMFSASTIYNSIRVHSFWWLQTLFLGFIIPVLVLRLACALRK